MSSFLTRGGPALALFAAAAVVASGCGEPAKTTGTGAGKAVAKADPDKEAGGAHSGWWCDEHALPEGVCDLCHKNYREAEKAKGNWCEHNRVKSSCFKCNPGLKEKYAAEYKAKFGKEPPAAEDDEKADEGKPKDKK